MNTTRWSDDPVVQRLTSIRLHVYLDITLVVPRAGPKRTPRAREVLRLDDMVDDIDRLALSLAHRYTDQSSVFLHTDELVAEAKATLVNVLEGDWLKRARTRAEFFKIVKSSMKNRMCSLVQTYRFTQKRTGIKPPPKHERNLSFESTKPNEISLDDPDSHLQVGEDFGGAEESNIDVRDLVANIRLNLNWAALAVFDTMIAPPLGAFVLAQLESYRGNSQKVRVQVTEDHVVASSEGVFTKETYRKAVLQVQQVTMRLRSMNENDLRYDAALQALSKVFGVQVPKSTPLMVTRRLFTIAARDNWKKVTPEVETDLTTVGAVAPKHNHDSMNCFGVMYQRGHKICESCGVKVACSTQAANIGLGAITISPKLLGAKTRRTPFILPNPDVNALPPASNVRDMTIIDYLWRHFKQVTHNGEMYMQLREFSDKEKLLFNLGESTIPLRLRFCKPGPILRTRLACVGKCYYLPDETEAETAILWINEHAKDAYAIRN